MAPQVVIIGAGHSGLILGARLKMQGVDVLIIEYVFWFTYIYSF